MNFFIKKILKFKEVNIIKINYFFIFCIVS